MGKGDHVRVRESVIFGHFSGRAGTITEVLTASADTFTVRLHDHAGGHLMITAREATSTFLASDLDPVIGDPWGVDHG
jgi:hypothetical protein